MQLSPEDDKLLEAYSKRIENDLSLTLPQMKRLLEELLEDMTPEGAMLYRIALIQTLPAVLKQMAN